LVLFPLQFFYNDGFWHCQSKVSAFQRRSAETYMMLHCTAGGTVWKERYLEHLTCFSTQGNCTM